MKVLKKLCLTIGLLLFFLFPGVEHIYARPFTIGVIDDCRSTSKHQILEGIKTEIRSLTKGEFDVKFPKSRHILSNCTEKEIQKAINKLFSDPEVDLILTLGPFSSQAIGTRQHFEKPVIAGLIVNPELQNIPFKKGVSGKDNFTYVAVSVNLKENIDDFKSIVPFNKAAFLNDKVLLAYAGYGKKYQQSIEANINTKIIIVPVKDSVESAMDKIDDTIEAVFVGNLMHFDNEGVSALISDLNKRKIPSFSFNDRSLVEKGLLAGFDRVSEKLRLTRRIALLIQRVLLGEDMKNFPVGFSTEDNLVINMQTARQINVSPGFAIMAKADLIKADEPLISPLKTIDSQKEILVVESVAPEPVKSKEPSEPAVKKAEPVKEITVSSQVSSQKIGAEQDAFTSQSMSHAISFKDAIEIAIKNNLILKSKEKEVAAGQMNVKDALSKFYPQVGTGLGGRIIDEEHTSAVSGVAERSWDIVAQVSQIIYSDKALTNLKTSRHYQKALELSENQSQLDIILETGLAYLNMLKARADAGIQLENLKLVRSNLTLANNRYKAGFSGPSDVYRLESEAANAYTSYLSALALASETRIHLNQILDFELEKKITITDVDLNDGLFIISNEKNRSQLGINNPKSFQVFRDFVVKKGLDQSPELMAIDEQIEAQKIIYEYAKRSYWSPDISVQGNVGNTFSRSGEGSDFNSASLPPSLSPYFQGPEDTYWSVALNITIPLYEGGAKSALKIKSLETENQLKFFRNQIENKIAENIRLTLHEAGVSFPAIKLSRLSASSSKKNLDLVVDAYSKGAVSIVDLLDAQNNSLVAKTMAENAVYDFFMDFISTERAAGWFSILMNPQQRQALLQEFEAFK